MAKMPKVVDPHERRTELAAALWRIVDRGELRPVSLKDIAVEAGVSVGLVQHYFAAKEDLLLFAQQQLQEEFDRRFARKIAGLPNPGLEVLKVFMHERLPLTRTQRTRGRVLLAWLTQVSWRPEWQGQVAALQRTACQSIAQALHSGQQDGRVPEVVHPEEAAFGLFALNEGLCAGLLNGLHTRGSALAVMDAQLRLLIPGEELTPTG